MKLIRLLKHDLAGEAARWCELGLIQPQQASEILQLYGTELPTREGRRFGYYALMAFAALFFGVGLIIFLSHNWTDIPRALRFIGLVALTLGVNAAGARYFFQNRLPQARITLFFGSICYGAAIFLIGQMFHLGEHFSNGLFLWAIGAAPLGLLSGSVLVMLLSATISTIWFFVELSQNVMPWGYSIFCGALLCFSLHTRRSIIVFLTAIVMSLTYVEGFLSYCLPNRYGSPELGMVHVLFTIAAFLLLNTLASVLTYVARKEWFIDYGVALKAWVSRFGAVTLVLLCFEDTWRDLIKEAQQNSEIVCISLLVYALIQCSSLLALWHNNSFDRRSFFWSQFSSLALGSCFILLSIGTLVVSRSDAEILMLCSNLMVIGSGIWLIYSAVRNATQSRFYLGVALLIFLALVRYFDLIGGYIGGATAFAIAGAIMFSAAKFWKHVLEARTEVVV